MEKWKAPTRASVCYKKNEITEAVSSQNLQIALGYFILQNYEEYTTWQILFSKKIIKQRLSAEIKKVNNFLRKTIRNRINLCIFAIENPSKPRT